MMETTGTNCQSCGMTIESGPYCHYCVDAEGNLQEFEERFERMVQFMERRNPDLSREEAGKMTLEYMSTMPAWRDHPRIAGRDG
ncbi:MAG: hypothetical protein GY769_02360 [bacterium]|nr:hypothetical protein [bacterium]